MPILGTELKMYRSALVSDTAASNGGKLSSNEVVSGLSNNILPDVPQAERLAGSTKLRKVFFKNANAANLPLLSPKCFLDKYTQGDDAVYFLAATQTDLESALVGTEKLYGCGKLDANRSAGATTLTVLIEDATTQFFKDGDTIRISDKPTVVDAGNEDFCVISGVPTIAGSIVTINLATPLNNAYLAATAKVSNVLAIADLKPTYSATGVTTSATGAVDFPQLALTNLGTLHDVWTVAFSSSTAFTVSGAASGAVGTGNVSSDFAPLNPSTSVPYFTLPAAAFSGVFAASDSVTFTTGPAACGLWVKRIVPAGAVAIVGNSFTLALEGETA